MKFSLLIVALIASVNSGLVYPTFGMETLLFEPKSGLDCGNVVPGSEELSSFSKFKSSSYSVNDKVCIIHLLAQYIWYFDFPNGNNIEKGKFRDKTYMNPKNLKSFIPMSFSSSLNRDLLTRIGLDPDS